MKRISLLALITAAALAQVPAQAAPATVAPTVAAIDEAPLAPVNTRLLQNHPGAPKGIDDVLLVPSASAGQKAVAFEWSGNNDAQAYILWKNYFAAAQFTNATAATDAQTIASFGLMNPGWGAGLSLAYADHTTEQVNSDKSATYRALSQAKLFGSMGWEGKDVYGSLLWKKPTDNVTLNPAVGSASTAPRTDSVFLGLGIRKYPAAGVEGLAWNGTAQLGYFYDRTPTPPAPVGQASDQTIWEAGLYGQLGYVFITDGIEFLPGVDAFVNYANGVNAPDYGYQFGASPYVAIILPLYEHWTLKGGARYAVEQTVQDVQAGKPSLFDNNAMITNTFGNVGLRYTHNRWAVEASVANGFLTNGPYFISGATTAGLMGSLALTVNLK